MLSKLYEDTSIPVTKDQASLIVSCYSLGSIVGPISMVLMVDRWGRKITMILIAITFLIGGTMLTFAQSYWWYYIGRLACGFATGNVIALVPTYLTEIAEDRIRGGLSILITVMFNSGTVISYSVGPWVSVSVFGAFGIAIPLVFFLLVPWMPETPYFYVMKGKPDLARRSLEFLRGTTDVDEEIEKLKKTVEFDLQNGGTLRELLTDKVNRKALLVVLGILSAQQLSGITIILYYSTTIFNQVSSNISSSISVIITGVVQLMASIVAVSFADRVGRRPLMLGSMFSSMVFIAALSAYFHLQEIGNDVSKISWLPVTAIVGYLSAYAVGLGSMALPILSELLPCNLKAYGMPIAATWSMVVGTVVTLVYPIVEVAYGNHTAFYSFTICVAVHLIAIFFYLPETRQKSLGEIQQMLRVRSE
ncbi:facilitated trehalose transporter Tret1-like [Diprion similis]|uniref:facilitated trehalose transporter Tret1-like n=1 Tax=Diprion similis TaxID=362088 RepID=UPI001EF940B8|nr:facilitated trehalose transporter Tret1-like [Diprion similis]